MSKYSVFGIIFNSLGNVDGLLESQIFLSSENWRQFFINVIIETFGESIGLLSFSPSIIWVNFLNHGLDFFRKLLYCFSWKLISFFQLIPSLNDFVLCSILIHKQSFERICIILIPTLDFCSNTIIPSSSTIFEKDSNDLLFVIICIGIG